MLETRDKNNWSSGTTCILTMDFYRHHSGYILSKVYQKALLWGVQMQDRLNAGTLPVNSAPAALLLWLFADESRCFVLSLSLFFCSLCVNSVSLKHTETSWHFPSFTSDDAFSITTAALFYEADQTSVTACGDESGLWAGKEAGCKKGMTSWPHVSSIHSFLYPACKSNSIFGLQALGPLLPSSCLRCHSAPKHEVPSPQSWTWMPALLPSTGDVETPSELLVETKSRWRMTCRHELNSCLITLDETPQGAACWLDKSLHGVFCQEWSLVVIVLNVVLLSALSNLHFSFWL